MTIAQQLEQKGREKGRQEGKEIGRQEGKEIGCREGIQLGKYEASLEIARKMLENGLDHVSIIKITGLTEEELKHIHH
ncbi:hypothetical protein [Nissabacter sp. SGAir0207]|uniref:hypothetical protein n=1 Tax=Nissabacter sp. SGAir0207 TaxID=2126321 RepID=UPI0010F965A7|nr:hypothetical protein [Nissabacter sp. SGAir0207]